MGRKGKFNPGKKHDAGNPSSPGADPIPGDCAATNPFVSRGGLKLRHALSEFGLSASGLWCADLGCSTGGFTDCLLQSDAARVFAVDTAYGELAWKIRQDERVVVMERTNAVHAEPPAEIVERGGVDIVVIDLGWTAQSRAIPAALRWINAAGAVRPEGRIISLIKPHYEVVKTELGEKGILDPARAAEVTEQVCNAMPGLGARVLGCVESPVLGGKKKGKGTGNREWLALLESAP